MSRADELVGELRLQCRGVDRADEILDEIELMLAKRTTRPAMWGATEITEVLGVKGYQNVYKLRGRGLPEPVPMLLPDGSYGTLARGDLYYAPAVKAFARKRSKARGGG